MARSTSIISSEFPFHVSARCTNREWFKIPLPEVWEIMSEYLHFLHRGFFFRIHSFVLMSNHFHMLVRTPQGNLSEGMNYFMRETSRQIGFESKRINQIYGTRFHRTVIKNMHHYLHVYKYVYRNPIEAGLDDKVEKYPFSTIHGLLGRSRLIIPIEEDSTLFSSVHSTLTWLNTRPSEENYFEIQRALKRREFCLASHPSRRIKSTLENSMY